MQTATSGGSAVKETLLKRLSDRGRLLRNPARSFEAATGSGNESAQYANPVGQRSLVATFR